MTGPKTKKVPEGVAPLFAEDLPPELEDVKAVTHVRTVWRVRVHPFDRFKGYDYVRESEEDTTSLVGKIKRLVRQESAAIVVEKDSVLHCLHVLEKGRWVEERFY